MTSETGYVANKLSFEERCVEAKNGLTALYKTIQEMAERDLQYRQESAERKEAFLNGEDDFVGQKFMEFMGPITSGFEKIQEGMLQSMWENGVDFERRIFGSDAVDFVLKELENERKHN